MDTVTLVENQIDDGQRLLDQLDKVGFAVRAACWIKPTETNRWSLYIVSPVVDEKGIMTAYREVLGVLRSLEGAWIDSADISLLGENHPISRDLIELQKSRLRNLPPQFRRDQLGNMPVDDVHVYSGKKVEVPVYGMHFVGDPSNSFHLSLEPHDPNSRLIVGTGAQSKEYKAKTGIDWLVAAPAGSTLERDEIGRMILAWNFRGRRTKSSANEVWSFANLGLNGFRFLREPA